MTEEMSNTYKSDYPCVTQTYTDVAVNSQIITQSEFEAHTADYRNDDQYQPPTAFITEMNAKLFTANAYGPNAESTFTQEKAKRYHEDLTRMCVESAPPIHTMAYEDTVPAPLYLFIGQLLLILAASQVHESFVQFTVGKEFEQERHNEVQMAELRNGSKDRIARKAGDGRDVYRCSARGGAKHALHAIFQTAVCIGHHSCARVAFHCRLQLVG